MAPVYIHSVPGLDNRGNILAALAFASLVYSLITIVAHALLGRAREWEFLTATVSLAVVVALAFAYANRVREHVTIYTRAAEEQTQVLDRLKAASRPPTGSTLFTFGHPAQVAPGVPVFSESWDLTGAVRVLWRDGSLAAYPVLAGTVMECHHSHVVPRRAPWRWDFDGVGYGVDERAPYGRTLFIDIPTGTTRQIASETTCRLERRRFDAGPLLLSENFP